MSDHDILSSRSLLKGYGSTRDCNDENNEIDVESNGLNSDIARVETNSDNIYVRSTTLRVLLGILLSTVLVIFAISSNNHNNISMKQSSKTLALNDANTANTMLANTANNALKLVKNEDTYTDAQTVECTSKFFLGFGLLLQYAMGFVREGDPVGAVVFGERGQFGAVRDLEDGYDHVPYLNAIVDQYDTFLNTCYNSYLANAEDNALCTYSGFDATEKVDMSAAIKNVPCIESCIESRLVTMSPSIVDSSIDFTTCTDPVEAVFIYAPSLVKSCLKQDYDCTEGGTITCESGCYDCLTACIEDDAISNDVGSGPQTEEEIAEKEAAKAEKEATMGEDNVLSNDVGSGPQTEEEIAEKEAAKAGMKAVQIDIAVVKQSKLGEKAENQALS